MTYFELQIVFFLFHRSESKFSHSRKKVEDGFLNNQIQVERKTKYRNKDILPHFSESG